MKHFDYEKPSKLGHELTAVEQKEVLSMYVNRYTGDHIPQWAKGTTWKDGNPYPVQFLNDADWLRHTLFQVGKNGRLTDCGECHSTPTWPHNPELRKEKVTLGKEEASK